MLWMVVAAVVGAGAGVVVGWLMGERRGRAGVAELTSAAAVAEGRVSGLTTQLTANQATLEQVRERCGAAERECAGLKAQLVSAKENLEEQRRLLDDAQVKLRDVFASVSSEALAKNNEAFLALARERFEKMSAEATGSLEERKAKIEGLLKPLHELLGQYQARLGDIERSRVESYSMLREQLGVLTETQRTLNTQTHQLVNALRRPTTRGQWGEITLRRLVELAGMSGRCDFSEQVTVEGEDGRLRPDMVVHLPGERQVVIDCKAVLDAFLDASAAADEESRRGCMVRHAQHLRERARELSAKSYWSQFKSSPEFVVMFLPGESFLYAAVEHDGALIEDCIKNRVVVATPTTLIALLKSIEFGWRQEQIAENAEKIRELGVQLFDRIVTLSGHFGSLGASLTQAVRHYNSAIGSLETRVLVTARRMAELGVRSDRTIDDVAQIDLQSRALTIGEATE